MSSQKDSSSPSSTNAEASWTRISSVSPSWLNGIRIRGSYATYASRRG